MPPLHLAMIPHLTELTGAPLTHLEYAIRMARDSRFRITFVVPGEGALTDRAREAGLEVKVVDNPPGGIAQAPGLLGKVAHVFRRRQARNLLAELLRELRPDAVFASSVVSVWPAMAAREAGIPCVYHLQEPAFSFPDTPANRAKADTIAAACRFIFTAPGSHAGMFAKSRQVEVHNAVDLGRYDLSRRSACRSQLLREFSMPDDAIIVTSVASISKRKGTDHLWEASYDLFFRHPRLHILAVGPDGGDAEFCERLRRLVAQSDFSERFLFLGPRDDVPEILMGSDIFALPTLADAQPLALIEAMAAGLPCVTTDVGDIPHMLLEGQIGFILPADDLQSLQVGIEKILDVPDVRRRYAEGVAARSRDFSYDHAMELVTGELLREFGS